MEFRQKCSVAIQIRRITDHIFSIIKSRTYLQICTLIYCKYASLLKCNVQGYIFLVKDSEIRASHKCWEFCIAIRDFESGTSVSRFCAARLAIMDATGRIYNYCAQVALNFVMIKTVFSFISIQWFQNYLMSIIKQIGLLPTQKLCVSYIITKFITYKKCISHHWLLIEMSNLTRML